MNVQWQQFGNRTLNFINTSIRRVDGMAVVGGLLAAGGRLLTVYHLSAPICNYTPGVTSVSMFAIGSITVLCLYGINKLAMRILPNILNKPVIKQIYYIGAQVIAVKVLMELLNNLDLTAVMWDLVFSYTHLCITALVALCVVFMLVVALLFVAGVAAGIYALAKEFIDLQPIVKQTRNHSILITV
jgi:hypothetical protein